MAKRYLCKEMQAFLAVKGLQGQMACPKKKPPRTEKPDFSSIGSTSSAPVDSAGFSLMLET